MKRKKNSNRSKRYHLRLSPEELENLQIRYKESTCRSFNEFLLDVLLEKPVTIRYRSQSLDEFLPIAIDLKDELNAVGKNFNQAVKKLHSLADSGDLKSSLQFFEATQFTLLKKVEEIKQTLIKSYELWSQK